MDRPAVLMLTLPLLGACAGNHSALDPAGPQAGRIDALWWFMLTVATVVYVLVIGALFYAAFRRRRPEPDAPARPDEQTRKRMTRAIAGATAITIVALFVFLIVNFRTGRPLTSNPRHENALDIELIGHQWWWEVRYRDSVAQNTVLTANEIHVPVGRKVLVKGTSRDVIHSFWVPNLNGKRDLIPGYVSTTWFQADTPGVYRGQCAEFCGYQHAKMALLVIAEPPAKFTTWLASQRRPASPPADSVQARGKEVFLGSACIMCHTIEGTPAGGNEAPDLTHLASRYTIAAGTLPNTRGHLGGWIVDPQSIKPGSNMPANQLGSQDLQALLTYLQSQK